MGVFLKALAKVGLVELSENEQQEAAAQDIGDVDPRPIHREDEIEPADDAYDDVQETIAADAAETGIPEGRPFAEIYAKAGVKPCAYPAEKLLRVLDGLKAMDPATRKAAVVAMDSADDEWTIEDPVLDAQRKIKALNKHQSLLAAIVTAAESKAEQDIAAQSDYQNQATQAIREEIEALERRLEAELKTVATEKARIEASLKTTREASERELSRIDQEMARLQELPATFIPTPATPNEP